MKKISLPLSKPIKAHGEEVTRLEFREPNGDDIIEIGAPPFLIDDKRRTHIDMAITAEYIVRLAAIPLSSVKSMAPADLMRAFGVVAGFFGGLGRTLKKSSEDTTASAGSTAED